VQHLDGAAELRQLLAVLAFDAVEYRLQSLHALDEAGVASTRPSTYAAAWSAVGQQDRQPAPENLEAIDQRVLGQTLVAEREEVEGADEVEVLDLGLGDEPAVDAALLLDQHLLIEEPWKRKKIAREDAGGKAEAAKARSHAFEQIDARSVI